jgi:signal transduction histidine kinase
MNNPLAAVMNLVYLAQSQATLDAETRGLLAQAQQELTRVAHISRQTLAFYKENTSSEDFAAGDLFERSSLPHAGEGQEQKLNRSNQCR